MAAERFREQLKRRAAMLAENGVDYAFDRKTPAPSGISGAGEAPSDLESIRTGMGDCRRCKLCEKRNTIVFGVGDPRARLMFIGEGPGADEDAQGIPFVGRAGRLLTDIITKGMGIRREDVYIANIVKCRPPENRNPEPDEVAACLPFLEAQIRAVAPEVIVTLGRVPLNSLLGYAGPMGKARGIWTDYQGIPLMPTFHPSYLLRNPAAKRDVWDDIQQVMARLGLKAPGRP